MLGVVSPHFTEADPQRYGVTIYVGGYPSLATQDALKTLAAPAIADDPFIHWSDIDRDGTWIFHTVGSAVARSLKPLFMSPDLAGRPGKPLADRIKLPTGGVPSAISDLVAYLRRHEVKWLEQEELDPKLQPFRSEC